MTTAVAICNYILEHNSPRSISRVVNQLCALHSNSSRSGNDSDVSSPSLINVMVALRLVVVLMDFLLLRLRTSQIDAATWLFSIII